MDIKFQKPSYKYEKEVMALCKEYQKSNTYIHGTCGLTKHDSFESWLSHIERMAEGKDIRVNDVQTLTYLVLDGEKIVGFVTIRPLINREYLHRGGNIMFSVLRDSQNNGYATAILTKALEMFKEMGLSKIRLTCHTDNFAATRVITKCGGVLESVAYCPEDGAEISRYWITIE